MFALIIAVPLLLAAAFFYSPVHIKPPPAVARTPKAIHRCFLQYEGARPPPSEPQVRTVFGAQRATLVKGYPSKGGWYDLGCSLAELEFLGLDRLSVSYSSMDQAEEDAHCARMRQQGAQYWPNEGEELEYYLKANSVHPHEPDFQYFGWPSSGGVWAIQASMKEASERGLGIVHNCITMEEQCGTIKKLGGDFYGDPKDCPYLNLDGICECEEERRNDRRCKLAKDGNDREL